MSTHPFRTQVMKHFSDSYEKVRSVSVDREFLRKKTFLIVNVKFFSKQQSKNPTAIKQKIL